jgi:isopenicillin-N epimerase
MDRRDWTLEPGVTYLNHGSFGPSQKSVQQARREWTERLEAQPMRFFVREMEQHLWDAIECLGSFLGTEAANLAFADNATFAMNVVASSVELLSGDQVLLTDHEYGAVTRIWRERCRQAGAELVVQNLPKSLDDISEVVSRFIEGVTKQTKLIVISHVTSATAAILPVEEICREARRRKIQVCIDGPHAVAMVPLDLSQIDCDYYCASCHKWLSAPFGTGFLYVAPRRQSQIKPAIISWGGSVSGREPCWQDEFFWSGTRDPAGFLAIPEAIRALEQHGLEDFRRSTHAMIRDAAERIIEITNLPPLLSLEGDRYGSMITLPIPGEPSDGAQHGRRDPLQTALWREHGIELPVFTWKRRRFLRVSCHLYNTTAEIDRCAAALSERLPRLDVLDREN